MVHRLAALFYGLKLRLGWYMMVLFTRQPIELLKMQYTTLVFLRSTESFSKEQVDAIVSAIVVGDDEDEAMELLATRYQEIVELRKADAPTQPSAKTNAVIDV